MTQNLPVKFYNTVAQNKFSCVACYVVKCIPLCYAVTSSTTFLYLCYAGYIVIPIFVLRRRHRQQVSYICATPATSSKRFLYLRYAATSSTTFFIFVVWQKGNLHQLTKGKLGSTDKRETYIDWQKGNLDRLTKGKLTSTDERETRIDWQKGNLHQLTKGKLGSTEGYGPGQWY